MEDTHRPWHLTLLLGALAIGVALVVAVSAWASGSDSPASSPAPAQYQPVQDNGSEDGIEPRSERRGHDCPDKDGDGGGGGDGSSSSQQDAPSAGTGGV
jgi:hypothetical protein